MFILLGAGETASGPQIRIPVLGEFPFQKEETENKHIYLITSLPMDIQVCVSIWLL